MASENRHQMICASTRAAATRFPSAAHGGFDAGGEFENATIRATGGRQH
jgi:hypothetical protein